jgi:hypothetical protein
MRHLQRALAPAALVVLLLGPAFFRMAEGGSFVEIDGHLVDPYGVVLYSIFLAALVAGVVLAYRSI